MENWKDIEGYEGLYSVSNLGTVKSLRRIVTRKNGWPLLVSEKVLPQRINSDGYYVVTLCKDGACKKKRVHRLFAIAFLANPDKKPFINHKNGIKTDCSLENLEWCTCKENNIHAFKTGLNFSRQIGKTGSKSQHAKKIVQISLSDVDLKIWGSAKDVEMELGFNHTNISKVLTGKRQIAYGFKWRYTL